MLSMQYRTFGRTGWKVSEIGYGMWGMAGWTGSDDEESRGSLDRAVALGCNFFDTAWAYGEGRSERLLGELLERHPDKRLYTATKIPPKNRKWPARAEYALDELFVECRRRNIAVIARVPFDEGSLTGTLTASTKWPDGDFRNIYFQPDNLRQTLERVDALRKLLASREPSERDHANGVGRGVP